MNATLSITDRFALSMDSRYRAVAARIAGRASEGRLIAMICKRLRRIEARVNWLVAVIQAGRLRLAGLGRPGQAVVRDAGAAAVVAASPRLPRGTA